MFDLNSWKLGAYCWKRKSTYTEPKSDLRLENRHSNQKNCGITLIQAKKVL